jgi:hypothetical protein
MKSSMKRLACIGLALPFFACVIPFVHSHREQPHTPQAIQRFSDETAALTRAPDAPALPEVTHSMSAAVEALPDVKDGGQLALDVRNKADAMTQKGPDETEALARASLNTALEAVRRARPSVSQADRDKAVEGAHQAIEKIEPGQRGTINGAYMEVARAMVVVTGGGQGAAGQSELSQLVARFAVEEPADARRTGAQAVAAMGDALQRLPRPPAHAGHIAHELRKRADELAKAEPLDYSAQLKDALSLVVRSLDGAARSPAERSLLDEAHVAVDTIRPDRPLQLQEAAVQEALRLVADAIAAGVSAP